MLCWVVVDIGRRVCMLFPVLGAAVGYLVDGPTGATSGFLIPMGPSVMVWLFWTP